MKKAFTLIELLVYIAIMAFIIVVAGRAFSDSTGMRIRTQSMTKATEEVNKISALLKEDLNQMGARAWFNPNPSMAGKHYEAIPEVYVNLAAQGGDSSSFKLWNRNGLANGNDSILFRKISYSSTGEYIAVREISWGLGTDGILRRSCVTVEASGLPDPDINLCPEENAIPVIMATDVRRFTLKPSSPANTLSFGGTPESPLYENTFKLLSRAKSGTDFHNETSITPPLSGIGQNTAILGGFTRNINLNGQEQNQVYVGDPGNILSNFESCHRFTFIKGETYEVKFKTPMFTISAGTPDSMMALFNPSQDHMAVGFRKYDGTKILPELSTDFMFYPSQYKDAADAINQGFEFSVPNTVNNACAVFTFAFYSGSPSFGPHKGRIRIKDFEVRQKTAAYVFDHGNSNYATENDTHAQKLKRKRDVKAFELVLEINKRGEIGSTRASDGLSGYVIATPNNGIVPQ